MKRILCTLLAVIVITICHSFNGCTKQNTPDYSKISEIRDKIYIVTGEYFNATCYLEERESPFISDGKVYDMKKILVVKINTSNYITGDCVVSLDESSSKLLYRAEADAYVATLNAESFSPNTSLLTFESEEKKEERPFTDITPKTSSYGEVYMKFLAQKSGELEQIEDNYEVRLRIIKRDEKAYWYIGIITKNKTICYLTDANGKIIASKTTLN